MNSQLINYVDITNYFDKRHIYQLNFEQFMVLAKCQADSDNNDNIELHNNHDKSILEILQGQTVRMYFDIENLDIDIKEIINKIIELLCDFINNDDIEKINELLYNNYALTQNINSRHEGKSYHLYFPLKTTMNDIYNFIKYFHYKTNNKYKNYIDWRVYSKNRLFRIVGSKCPGQQNFPRKLNDYHKLIKGNLEDTIIQNNIDLYEIKINYNIYLKQIDNNFNKLMKEINNNNKNKFSSTPKNKWDNFKYQYNAINIINNIINSINNNIKNNNNENNNTKNNNIENNNIENNIDNNNTENNINKNKKNNNDELLQLLKIMKDNIYNNINTNKKINNIENTINKTNKYNSINIYQVINNVIIIIILLILMIYILFKKN